MLKSKQRLLELNSKLAEALTSKGVSASANETTTTLINKVKNISGADKLIEFNQVRSEVQIYIDNVTYDPSDYTTSQIAEYVTTTSNNYPMGCKINLQSAGTLTIYDINGGSTVTASVAGDNYIYNLTPNAICRYENVVNGNVSEGGTIKATGAMRMIKSEKAVNVRDLGGWNCDGGTVKYGKLFRGGQCYSEDTDVLCNMLKIEHELNLRYADEITSYSSPLGNNVEFTHIDGSWYTIANKSNIKLMMECIFDCVTRGKPLYYHCASGADRTGTLTLLILAVLGVSQSDIDKDYELTCFYTGVDTDNHARRRNENEWKGLINSFSSYTGETFRDKVVNYLVSTGITISDINAFRQNMIEGTPEELAVSGEEAPINLFEKNEVTLNKRHSGTSIVNANGFMISGYIPSVAGDILNIFSAEKINYESGTNCPVSQKIAYYDSSKNLLGTEYMLANGATNSVVTTVIDDNNTTIKIGYHGNNVAESYADSIAYVMIEFKLNSENTALTSDDIPDLVVSKKVSASITNILTASFTHNGTSYDAIGYEDGMRLSV